MKDDEPVYWTFLDLVSFINRKEVYILQSKNHDLLVGGVAVFKIIFISVFCFIIGGCVALLHKPISKGLFHNIILK